MFTLILLIPCPWYLGANISALPQKVLHISRINGGKRQEKERPVQIWNRPVPYRLH